MKLSRNLLMGSIAGATLVVGEASAQGLFQVEPEWYVKGFGGASFLQSTDATDSTGIETRLEFETGYVLGLGIGARFTPNFAIELEYAFRDADMEEIVDPDDRSRRFGGTFESNSFMLNGIYDFDGMGPGGAWRPYAGAGLGATWLELDTRFTDGTNEFTTDTKRDSVLAYQVFGGVAYDITANAALFGELRWFGTEGGRFSVPGGGWRKADYETADLLVGASFGF